MRTDEIPQPLLEQFAKTPTGVLLGLDDSASDEPEMTEQPPLPDLPDHQYVSTMSQEPDIGRDPYDPDEHGELPGRILPDELGYDVDPSRTNHDG